MSFLRTVLVRFFISIMFPISAAVVIGACVLAVALYDPRAMIFYGYRFASVLTSSVTFGSVVCSFGGMALSVLMGSNSELMKKMRRGVEPIKQLGNLLGVLIGSGLILSLLSLALMFVPEHGVSGAAVLWAVGVVFCVASIARTSFVMILIFTDPEGGSEPEGRMSISRTNPAVDRRQTAEEADDWDC